MGSQINKPRLEGPGGRRTERDRRSAAERELRKERDARDTARQEERRRLLERRRPGRASEARARPRGNYSH